MGLENEQCWIVMPKGVRRIVHKPAPADVERYMEKGKNEMPVFSYR